MLKVPPTPDKLSKTAALSLARVAMKRANTAHHNLSCEADILACDSGLHSVDAFAMWLQERYAHEAQVGKDTIWYEVWIAKEYQRLFGS